MKYLYILLFIIPLSLSASDNVPHATFTKVDKNWEYSQNFESLAIVDDLGELGYVRNKDGDYWIQGVTLPGWYLSCNIAEKYNATFTQANGIAWGVYEYSGFYSYGYVNSTNITQKNRDNKTNAECIESRSLGGLTSKKQMETLYYGVIIKNNTGKTIISLDISYTGHLWKSYHKPKYGSNYNKEIIEFSYVINPEVTVKDSKSMRTPVITDNELSPARVTQLDFTVPIKNDAYQFHKSDKDKEYGKIDGQLKQNKQTVSGVISGINIPDGATILLRWKDNALASSGHGYGKSIDNLKVVVKSTK